MNYDYIESLVIDAKSGNEAAKEKLVQEFKPFIVKLSYKTFIHGYDKDDIINEGYKVLFKCISLYKTENHRFVAYAINGIKNGINDLIRHYKNHEAANENYQSLSICDYLEDVIVDDTFSIDQNLMNQCLSEILSLSIDKLSAKDKEIINLLFFKGQSLKTYAANNNICYSTAFRRRNAALDRLSRHINPADISI